MAERKLDAEQIELQWKQMQIEEMQERMAERREKRARLAADRQKQYEDFLKSQAERLRRQRVCKHRKGGRDNHFAKGDANAYSIIHNTYPDGREVIMCTRCAKEVEKPSLRLRKKEPKLYEQMREEWNKWNDYPTDNSASGGKIFEITEAA